MNNFDILKSAYDLKIKLLEQRIKKAKETLRSSKIPKLGVGNLKKKYVKRNFIIGDKPISPIIKKFNECFSKKIWGKINFSFEEKINLFTLNFEDTWKRDYFYFRIFFIIYKFEYFIKDYKEKFNTYFSFEDKIKEKEHMTAAGNFIDSFNEEERNIILFITYSENMMEKLNPLFTQNLIYTERILYYYLLNIGVKQDKSFNYFNREKKMFQFYFLFYKRNIDGFLIGEEEVKSYLDEIKIYNAAKILLKIKNN
jgi:hypothetical protein